MVPLAFRLPLEFSQGEAVAEDRGARGEREAPLTTPPDHAPCFCLVLGQWPHPSLQLRLQLPRGVALASDKG